MPSAAITDHGNGGRPGHCTPAGLMRPATIASSAARVTTVAAATVAAIERAALFATSARSRAIIRPIQARAVPGGATAASSASRRGDVGHTIKAVATAVAAAAIASPPIDAPATSAPASTNPATVIVIPARMPGISPRSPRRLDPATGQQLGQHCATGLERFTVNDCRHRIDETVGAGL